MGEKTITVVGIKDRWNATNERTINGRDAVLVQVTEDGKTHVEEISVSQYLNDDRFEGSAADRMLGLANFKAFSLQDRPVTMSLPLQTTALCYTAKLLSYIPGFSPSAPEQKPADKKGSGGSKEPVATV
jgi:hypothetical protein